MVGTHALPLHCKSQPDWCCGCLSNRQCQSTHTKPNKKKERKKCIYFWFFAVLHCNILMIRWKIHSAVKNLDKQWKHFRFCEICFLFFFVPRKWNEICIWPTRNSILFLCVSTPFRQTERHIITPLKKCWAINWSEMKDTRWNIQLNFVELMRMRRREKKRSEFKAAERKKKNEKKPRQNGEFQFFVSSVCLQTWMSGICRTCKLSTNSSWKITT